MSFGSVVVAPVEVIEQDTTEIEDIADLLGFIVPEGDVPTTAGQFGVYYNRKVFNGWVKQPSPCCGAASVAGAWNSLCCFHRSDRMALAHTDVLDIYKSMFVELIDKKRSAFERKLGAPIASLIDLVVDKLPAFGKSIGGGKGSSLTKKILSKLIIDIASERLSSRPPSTDNDATQMLIPMNPVDCIIDLLKGDGYDFAVPIDSSIASGTLVEVPDPAIAITENGYTDNLENLSEESDLEEEEAAVPSKSTSKWDWKSDLMGIFRTMSGLAKLASGKPNTAAIGNWGILECVRLLSDAKGMGTYVSARLFMGKKKFVKSKVDIPLSSKDSEDVITTQWDALRSHFTRNNTILLFHLKNHYALIFALREWTEYRDISSSHQSVGDEQLDGRKDGIESSKTVIPVTMRQMLTARKGQRPTAWIDFSEARETMIGWEGYKIMAITSSNIALSALQSQIPSNV